MVTQAVQKVTLLLLVVLTTQFSFAQADFPSDENAYASTKAALGAVTGDYMRRNVKRIGDQTLELEAFILQSGSLPYFAKIAADTPKWRDWALNGINEKLGGGGYLVQLLDLKPLVGNSGLDFYFKINLPTLRKVFNRAFEISVAEKPGQVTVLAKSIESDDSILNSVRGKIWVFPAVGQKDYLWVHLIGYAHIKSWLLYQALPEKLLMRESAHRLQTILDNYTAEEIRQMESKPHKKKGNAG